MDRSERAGGAVERRHGNVNERIDRLDEERLRTKYQMILMKILRVRVSLVRARERTENTQWESPAVYTTGVYKGGGHI